MDPAACEIEGQLESTHWWFVGRRRLFRRELRRLSVSPRSRVLDVGIGGGSNLRMLGDMGFTNVTALDFLADNLVRARGRYRASFVRGDATRLPFGDGSFHLLLATDVIEHLDDDTLAMRELQRVLKPAGVLLVTVPAFMSLWGLQDIVSAHRRRYRQKQLLDLFDGTLVRPHRCYYFNFVLFPAIWLVRQLVRRVRTDLRSENEINSPAINAVLKAVFTADVSIAPILRPPFGVSIIAVGTKAVTPTSLCR